MALLGLSLEFLPTRTDLHVLLTVSDVVEDVADVVLAVDGGGLACLSHRLIAVVVDSLLGVTILALVLLMVDQFFLVAEEVRARKLAPVDDFSAAVATPGDVELPLGEDHQSMVWVERANEDVVVVSLVHFTDDQSMLI